MLINFSNHPYIHWSEKQKLSAGQLFGEIVDIPFPTISPESNEEVLLKMAKEYLNQILNFKRTHNDITVHIMGEFTFTFIMIQLLHQHNIPCYASTTKRLVKEIVDGNMVKKVSIFEFVSFRKYLTI